MRISEKTCVSAPEIALVLGLTRRRVDQLVVEDVLPKVDGRFPLAEGVRNYIEQRLKLDRLPNVSNEAERLRILTARRQLLEFEVETVKNLALDPQHLLVAIFGVVGRNMSKLWNEARNVWPPFLASSTKGQYEVQRWVEGRLWPLWDDFAAEIREAAPEPHRTAFREAREREAKKLAAAAEEAAKRKPTPLQEEALRRAAARAWTGAVDDNPYLRPGETLADVQAPVPGLLEEVQARRKGGNGAAHE